MCKSGNLLERVNFDCVFYVRHSKRHSLSMGTFAEPLISTIIWKHVLPPIFWPNLGTVPRAWVALETLERINIEIEPKVLNPPSCPELRPIEPYFTKSKYNIASDRIHEKRLGNSGKFHIKCLEICLPILCKST